MQSMQLKFLEKKQKEHFFIFPFLKSLQSISIVKKHGGTQMQPKQIKLKGLEKKPTFPNVWGNAILIGKREKKMKPANCNSMFMIIVCTVDMRFKLERPWLILCRFNAWGTARFYIVTLGLSVRHLSPRILWTWKRPFKICVKIILSLTSQFYMLHKAACKTWSTHAAHYTKWGVPI